MSFKEDFFEALRIVKRDFFRESDYGPQNQPANEESRGEASRENKKKDARQTSDLIEGGDFVMPGDIIADDNVKSAASFGADSDVMEAFNRASALDSSAMEISDSYDEDGGLHKIYGASSSEDSALFRRLDGGDTDEVFFNTANMPVSNDARKIYDLDTGDLYTDDRTIISRNTIVRGTLHTDDSVRLLGQILGDIECKSNIVIAGKVRGNTTAANAYVIDAQIDGNMLCDDTVNVNKDAWVLGNIRAQQAEIDGKIKGNIEIRHAVSVGPASSIIGNISTDELEIKRGAFVNGQIIMYSPSRDVLDKFEDFDRQ